MKQKRFFFITALMAFFLALNTLVTSAASHETVQVSALDFEFDAPAVTITAGHTVEWMNDGNAPHTVTGSDDSWDSGRMESGDTYAFTFDAPGTYAYYCRFHGSADGSGMAGVITVVAEEAEEVMPSITIEDQTVSGNQIVFAEVVAAQDGWIVVHNTDAEGNVIVPDIISEPVMVSAGTNNNVVVTLTEDVPDNHTLIAMLHIDDGQMGVYEFPDADPPALIGEDLVVVGFSFGAESNEVVPSIMVEDQMISGGQVMIAEVVAAQDGWLVIHSTDAEGNVIVPDIISEPVLLSAGTHSNVMVTLTEDVPNNHVLYAMLHIDDGQLGVYEFPDADGPALVGEDLVIVPFTVTVEAMEQAPEMVPSIAVNDQMISGGQVVIAEVVAAQDGWLVIHNTDAEGNVIVPDIISEPVLLSAGTHSNVMVTLTEDVPNNHVLYAMLHIDDGQLGVYEFPDADGPALVGEDLVIVPFTVTVEAMEQAPEMVPSIMVNDQAVSGGQVVIAEVVAAQDGWLVIHNTDAEGNVIVPDIISEPVLLSAGTHSNVMVTLTEEVPNNHVLYAMLHIDDGQLGVYEFPDADGPALVGEDLVIVPFTVMAESSEVVPSIMVNDQAVSGGQVVIAEVVAAQDGWLVIHNTDAEGNVIVPDIISEPVMVSAGTHSNVMVTLTEDVPNNHVLYAMLHIDDGQIGVYEFPDADGPALVGEDLVIVPFTVTVPQLESMPAVEATPSQQQTDLIRNVINKFNNRPQ